MLFDFKSGFKGIAAKWVAKLTAALPPAHRNIPVFRLSC
jgi:hypothetical protein